jgi:hypothetical protein
MKHENETFPAIFTGEPDASTCKIRHEFSDAVADYRELYQGI